MSGTRQAIEESYQACRRVARRAGSSFYPSFLLLSRAKRRAMYALYAFLRHTDDLGDSPAPVNVRRESLARWRASLAAALRTPRGKGDSHLLCDDHASMVPAEGPCRQKVAVTFSAGRERLPRRAAAALIAQMASSTPPRRSPDDCRATAGRGRR